MNTVMPKVHIANTNLPDHLEEMLTILIDEENRRNATIVANVNSEPSTPSKRVPQRECFDFVLANRPFDLLTDICLTDSPPGASVCILHWMRRFLTCLQDSRLDHKSILQPIKKLIAYCSSAAGHASPYEHEEIVFLLTVAGVIRKEVLLLHLFLPEHEHSYAVASLDPSLGMKTPVKNTLFENAKIQPIVRRVSLLQDTSTDLIDASTNECNDLQSKTVSEQSLIDFSNISCDCNENDTFILFDTILRYFDSAVSRFLFRFF